MLASILKPSEDLADRDYLIFLTNEELDLLEGASLKGDIFEFQDVRNVYPLEIHLDPGGGNTLHGIGLYFENNLYRVGIERDLYPQLKKDGWYGTRPNDYSKLDIMTEAYAKEDEEYSRDFRSIKSRWNHRPEIIEKMQRECL
jgi:hypothetical protein